MFGAQRVETYRNFRGIEQPQVLVVPPEGYDSPSWATPLPPPPLDPLRPCGRCLVLEHNTATRPRIEPSASTLWPPFLIQQKAMHLLYFSSVAFHLLQLVLILILHFFNDSLFQNLQIQNFLRILQFDSINRVSMAVTIGRPHWKDINRQPQIG